MVEVFKEREQNILQNLLKRIRQDSGRKQTELANEAGFNNQSIVSKYESGERRLDILELRRICIALDISLAEFCQRLEKEIRDNEA